MPGCSMPPNKAQEMVDRAGVPLALERLAAICRMANLGVEHGYLDPSNFNEAGAGHFLASSPGGAPQPILVMVRDTAAACTARDVT